MDALLKKEAGPTALTSCATCGGAVKLILYRCRQCLHPPLLCDECIVSAHCRLPFHVVEEWDASKGFWKRVPLSKLGLIIDLGHDGKKCTATKRETHELIVMHEHGIHRAHFRFCGCLTSDVPSVPKAVQLLEAGFWPASWKRPTTAFSLEVMREFELLAVHAHDNGSDYCAAMRRRTDGTRPDDVPVSSGLSSKGLRV